ncbi:EamA family transporter RarD [Brevirhabdus sp.]|uniref:EamA family transporter RarD n=1 Tax=Brevirhabdus sp. TaxID=2004514 RepID=UPI0040587F7B
MDERQKGRLAMIGACTIWGLSPIFYKLIAYVDPLEVLSHRTLWSLVFFALVLMAQGRVSRVTENFRNPRVLGVIALSGLAISLNWGLFIWSVQVGRATEASLGYYIFPLVSVALGALIYKERLSPVKVLAVVLAAAAVLTLSLGLGVTPWVSLALAATFGTYGLLKKGLDVGPVVSVTTEVLLLSPLALLWLAGAHVAGWASAADQAHAVFLTDGYATAILLAAGPVTAGPLVLFSYASRRLPMATVGLMQYLNPTLQFLVATLVFQEVFTGWHALAFGLIWLAVIIFTAEGMRQERADRRMRSRSPAVDAGVI